MWLLAKFWHWWWGELSTLFPAWIGVAFFGQTSSNEVIFRHNISRLDKKKNRLIVPVELFEASPPVLPALSRSVMADVYFPKDKCMSREIEVPAKAASKIQTMAALDLKRNTPFADGDLLWILDTPKKLDGKIVATQWAAKRAEGEHVRRKLQEIGVRVRSIRIEGIPNVLKDYSSEVASGTKYWKWINAALLIGILGTAGFLWLGPAWIAQQNADATNIELSALRAETLALRQDVDTMQSDRARLDDLQASLLSRPRLIETLRELTITLPDQSWVSNMSFQPTAFTFGGETSGATVDLILALSKSNFFANPRQSGPTTRTGSGGERFEIAVSLGAAQ